MAEKKETTETTELLAKIAALEAENAEVKGIVKEMQDKLEAKAHQTATGNPTFIVEGQKIEMLAKRVRLNFEHKENGIEKKAGDTVNAEELEKMPALIHKLLSKKIGVLVVK